MLENVQFFSHLHSKFAKSAIMTQIIFLLEKYHKNAEFYADFKFVDAAFRNAPNKI